MEFGEQPRQVFGADTFATVLDLEAQPRLGLGTHPNRDVCAIPAELDRIGKIVVQDLPQFAGIENDTAKIRRDFRMRLPARPE